MKARLRTIAVRARETLRSGVRSQTWTDPPLPFPPGLVETQAKQLISSIAVDDAPPSELEGYWREAFGRFLRTWDLARTCRGRALELGANPYFLTILLKEFSSLEMSLANYFGPNHGTKTTQRVHYRDAHGTQHNLELTSSLFDAEREPFPFPADAFQVVFFCEILEHMTEDPLAALREINRVLVPDGHLILTTPNVARLENVARMVLGENIYDPYSGYGPTGRHNREYNCHELAALLTHAGFAVESLYTADSHPIHPHHRSTAARVRGMGGNRTADLGQYIFCRARRVASGGSKLPRFLYRSYPSDMIEDAV